MIPKALFLSYLAVCVPRLGPPTSPTEVAVLHEAAALHRSSIQPAAAIQQHSPGFVVQSNANDVDDTKTVRVNDLSPSEDFGDDDLTSFSVSQAFSYDLPTDDRPTLAFVIFVCSYHLYLVPIRRASLANPGSASAQFEALPPGDWDERKLINGTFRLETDGTSRVWSLRDAWPNLPLPPPRGQLRAFGTYPAGSAVRIVFPDGPRQALILTFAFIVNGGFRAGEWRADTYEDGRFVTGASARFGFGWTREQVAFRGDDIRFMVRDAEPTGVLLLGFLEYGRQLE